MMRVYWHTKRGKPTTCERCHLAILPGDPYVTWQTWGETHHRCQGCGVPPRHLVSISRLRIVYWYLEHNGATPGRPYWHDLHQLLTKVRQAYLQPGRLARTPQGKARKARAEVLTMILDQLERVQQNLEHVQKFCAEALELLQTVDPLVVAPLKHYTKQEQPPAVVSLWDQARVVQLRKSGYGSRTIAKKLGLKERDVKGVA